MKTKLYICLKMCRDHRFSPGIHFGWWSSFYVYPNVQVSCLCRTSCGVLDLAGSLISITLCSTRFPECCIIFDSGESTSVSIRWMNGWRLLPFIQETAVLGLSLLPQESIINLVIVWVFPKTWVSSWSSHLWSIPTSCARSTGQEERRCYRILLHTFIQSCFFLFISPLFISLPCFYISLVFISPPLIVILSRIIILPLTRASHSYILSVPIHAQQATPPHQARSFS